MSDRLTDQKREEIIRQRQETPEFYDVTEEDLEQYEHVIDHLFKPGDFEKIRMKEEYETDDIEAESYEDLEIREKWNLAVQVLDEIREPMRPDYLPEGMAVEDPYATVEELYKHVSRMYPENHEFNADVLTQGGDRVETIESDEVERILEEDNIKSSEVEWNKTGDSEVELEEPDKKGYMHIRNPNFAKANLMEVESGSFEYQGPVLVDKTE